MITLNDGYFEFTDYYLTASTKSRLIVRESSRINHMIADGIDVYNIAYKPFHVPTDIYRDHIRDNVSITTFSDGTQTYIVPNPYVKVVSKTNIHPYTPYGVTIDIGLLTQSEQSSLPLLETYIRDIVINTMGITPVIQFVKYGKTRNEDADTHEAVQVGRLTSKNIEETLLVQNITLRSRVADLEEEVQAMVAYVGTL